MEEQKIVGVENTSFTGKDGTPVTGETIHTTEHINPERGKGERTDHFFLSTAKLSTLDFVPAPGQTVTILYNRYGKVATLHLLSDDNVEVDID